MIFQRYIPVKYRESTPHGTLKIFIGDFDESSVYALNLIMQFIVYHVLRDKDKTLCEPLYVIRYMESEPVETRLVRAITDRV